MGTGSIETISSLKIGNILLNKIYILVNFGVLITGLYTGIESIFPN